MLRLRDPLLSSQPEQPSYLCVVFGQASYPQPAAVAEEVLCVSIPLIRGQTEETRRLTLVPDLPSVP